MFHHKPLVYKTKPMLSLTSHKHRHLQIKNTLATGLENPGHAGHKYPATFEVWQPHLPGQQAQPTICQRRWIGRMPSQTCKKWKKFRKRKFTNLKMFAKNTKIIQGFSWCDEFTAKVLTKFCKPNSHSKYV